MDPVTGLGLAASVIQIVTFSIRTVEACRQMYQQGAISEYDSLDDRTRHLANLTRSLQQSLPSSGGRFLALTSEEKDLVALGRKCQECADKLQEELRKLQTQPHASALDVIRRTARAIWKKNTIDKLHKELLAYRSTLETSLLSRLSKRFDVQGVIIDKSFTNLDTNLKHLVTCLAKSQTSLGELVVQQSEKTRHCIDHLHDLQIYERRYKEIVDSLSYPDIFSRQEQVDDQFDGIKSSYDWIFETPKTRRVFGPDKTPQAGAPLWDDFGRWLRSGHGVYWINGKAGSGKSTLMNRICAHKRRLELLGEWCPTRRLSTPKFFFWNSGSRLQKSIDGLLRSLVYQLLIEYRDLIECFDNDPLRTWTTDRLQTTLLNLLKQSQVPVAVCMFIDGLDEFDGLAEKVIDMITALADQTHVKACVSSRPLIAFEGAFSGKPSLRLQDLTYSCISEYAEEKLSQLIQERVSLDKNDRRQAEDLITEIVARANGVFLWAIIAIRDVREGLRESADMNELVQMIESLPSELEKLFMRMIDRIKPAYQRYAVQSLQTVLHSEMKTYGTYTSHFRMDLCTLYFSHSQRELGNAPFFYEEIPTSELVTACRTLKTRLLSHTAGLLDLGRTGSGDRLYGKWQDLDLVLFTQVNFLHRTVRDFLLNNTEAKSRLASIGSTEAQVRLSIARGILAQSAHFSPGDAKMVDKYWPHPVYSAFLASMQQISLAERLLGAAQASLMRSLDFATIARGYVVPDTAYPLYVESVEAFMIKNSAETVDLVGMAAAVGMTHYVCQQLELPIGSSRYSPALPDPNTYSSKRHTAATLCWIEGDQLQDPGSILASGWRSSNYRQTLARCLQWKTNNPLSLQTAAQIEIVPLAETYMLSCCKPTSLDLTRILLRAGANPMAAVECIPPINLEMGFSLSFWHSWLHFLLGLRYSYMKAKGKSGGMIFKPDYVDAEVRLNDILDTTKALLVHGADISYELEPSTSMDETVYLKRPGLQLEKKMRFDLTLTSTAIFTLQECFSTEPEFRQFLTAMEPLATKQTRRIVGIGRIECYDGGLARTLWENDICPSTEETNLLWPLLERWERTGRRDDLDSLQAAMEAVIRAHCPEEDLQEWGLDPSADHKADDGSGLNSSTGDEDDDSHGEGGSDDSDDITGSVVNQLEP